MNQKRVDYYSDGLPTRVGYKMQKSHTPCNKLGQPNARIPKKNLRKQSPFVMKRRERCTDKTTSGVFSPNFESFELIGDIEKLELVKRRALKIPKGF